MINYKLISCCQPITDKPFKLKLTAYAHAYALIKKDDLFKNVINITEEIKENNINEVRQLFLTIEYESEVN